MSVEMVLLTPALILLMLFVVGAGRVVEAQGQADGAARDAARAASLQEFLSDVPTAATHAAQNDLDPAGKNICPNGMTASAVPDSTTGATQVTANVNCTINLLIVPGFGVMTVTGHAVAPVDTYVERDW